MYSLMTVIRIAVLLISVSGTAGLKDVEFRAPEAVERGSRLVMHCKFDLEGETLYQVKWYRGDREFCRYAPRDVPPLKVFQIKVQDTIFNLGTIVLFFEIRRYIVGPGVNFYGRCNFFFNRRTRKLEFNKFDFVKLRKDYRPPVQQTREETTAQRLVIDNVTDVANGQFTCEVSADEPSFATTRVYKYLYVVQLPKGYPHMTGLKPRYKPGAKLKVECISANSSPAANISFFINDQRALEQHVWHRVDGNETTGLFSAFSTIQFIVQEHHFRNGKLRLRCTAFIYDIYCKSREKVSEEVPLPTTSTTGRPEPRKAIVNVRPKYVFTDEKDTAAQVSVPSSASQDIFTIALLFLSGLVIK